jgi:hypothetical protein
MGTVAATAFPLSDRAMPGRFENGQFWRFSIL